jgi:hypothetical protein
MISIPKVVWGISGGVVLCLSVSDAPQAAEKINPNDCAEMKAGHRDVIKCEKDRRQGIDTVKGEVLDIEEGTYVVQRFYGKEVQLRTDPGTEVAGTISLGDSIEAIVTEEKDERHLRSIRKIR